MSEGRKAITSAFDDVLDAEWKRVHQRRKLADQHEDKTEGRPENLVGLAFSGGGIRSATFNLGVIQKLNKSGLLNKVDYLSTVSGGGYLGGSYTWFASKLNKGFPFEEGRLCFVENSSENSDGTPKKMVEWLRKHGSYLVDGISGGKWSFVAAILLGSVVNLAIIVPVLMAFLWLGGLNWIPPFMSSTVDLFPFLKVDPLIPALSFFQFLFRSGLVMLAGLIGFMILYGVFSGLVHAFPFKGRARIFRYMGMMLWVSLSCIVAGLIPELAAFHKESDSVVAQIVQGLGGLSAIVSPLFTSSDDNNASVVKQIIVGIGLFLVVYLGLVHLYRISVDLPGGMIFSLVGVSVVGSIFSNINRYSLHRYYRDRLLEAYMPPANVDDVLAGRSPLDLHASNACHMDKIGQTEAPFHLINTNMVTVSSKCDRLKSRGGDSFVISPEYCGAPSTGYADSAKWTKGSMDLATAYSISGAAVGSNTLALTQYRPIAFLMSVFNIRLGYWTRNPFANKTGSTNFQKAIRANPIVCALKEMTGLGFSENSWHVKLTDGGHFENLGVYELIRRQCDTIIVSDAGMDSEWKFEDLGNLIELLEEDCLAEITDLDLDLISPDERGRSPLPVIRGKIRYINADSSSGEPKDGVLIYVKTTMPKDLKDESIEIYKRQNPDFPDQSTMDQFFDRAQFEAYRQLGNEIGQKVVACYEKPDECADKDGVAKVVSDSENTEEN
ncbi:MAG: hypothetical protein HQL54_06025 [Magnetococcales bacterium]|nr:hypothetical protein [Magnetococcales bacterium]